MKLIVEIKNEPKKGDILLYNGEQWIAKSKNVIVKEVKQEIEDLKKIRGEFEDFKKAVNNKLKDYHNILQTLTKEE